MTAGLFARIALRYLAGMLIAKALVDSKFGTQLATDVDLLTFLELAIGGTAAFVAEWGRKIAKRMGWAT